MFEATKMGQKRFRFIFWFAFLIFGGVFLSLLISEWRLLLDGPPGEIVWGRKEMPWQLVLVAILLQQLVLLILFVHARGRSDVTYSDCDS